MRVRFVVLVLLMGCLTLLGPTTGLTQYAGWRNRGGGPGVFPFDPGIVFDRIAQGRGTINISEIRRGQEEIQEWAQKQGIINGQLTRDQYIAYSRSPEAARALERRRAQWGGGSGLPASEQRAGAGSPTGSGMTSEAGDTLPGRGRRGTRRGAFGSGGGDPNAWIDERFRRLDRNGDGYLNYEEMTDNLKAEKDKWDTNRDGQIDLVEWREYVKAFAQQRRQEAGRASWGGAGGNSGLASSASSDQSLKKFEPRKRVIVYRSGKLPPNLPAWFKEYDTDKDAQVALYEWKDKNRTVGEFQQYDLNGDGFITVEELIRSGVMIVNRTNAFASENPSNGTSSGSLAATLPRTVGSGGPADRPGRGSPSGQRVRSRRPSRQEK
jgi:hypothetical protein